MSGMLVWIKKKRARTVTAEQATANKIRCGFFFVFIFGVSSFIFATLLIADFAALSFFEIGLLKRLARDFKEADFADTRFKEADFVAAVLAEVDFTVAFRAVGRLTYFRLRVEDLSSIVWVAELELSCSSFTAILPMGKLITSLLCYYFYFKR